MKIGDFVKVHLPGESPWAQCVSIIDNNTWYGRIDNKLVGTDLHPFKYNDIVKFTNEYTDGKYWVSASYDAV